jgi:hypothetical protein
MLTSRKKSCSIVIVCQLGELELNSVLLVSTLRKYLTNDANILIGIPESGKINFDPGEITKDFFRHNKARIFYFKNSYLETIDGISKTELISNKIYVLKHSFNTNKILFLDSDTICIGNFHPEEINNLSGISLKPANRASITKWEEIYSYFDIEFPEELIQTGVDKQYLPNYFNSGVILLDKMIKDEFVDIWEKYYLNLANKEMTSLNLYKNYFRDQIALSLTISHMGKKITFMDEKFNYPVGGKRLIKSKLPVLVHYHNPYNLCAHAILFKELTEFLKKYPDFLNLVDQQIVWYRLLRKGKFMRNLLLQRRKMLKRWGRMKERFRMY